MLRDRIIAAGVLIALIVPLLIWGGVEGVTLLVALAVCVGLLELCAALPGLRPTLVRVLTVATGLALVGAFYFLAIPGLFAVVIFLPLFVLILHLIFYHSIENTVDSASHMILALAYVAIPLGHAILMRKFDHGVGWVFLVLFVVCLGDTGAYFAGKRFGKHRLVPTISPSKTVEGLAGVIAGGFVGMVIVKLADPGLAPLKTLVPLTVLLAFAGPVGDLIASALKRRLQVKDFGSLLPGHGGLMDRADSLIMAFPVGYHFLVLTEYAK